MFMITPENKTTNDVLKFFLKLLLLLVMIKAIDMAIGSVLRHFYFRQSSGLEYRTTYSMEKTTADLIVLGSSRANHHYPPDVFEKKLDLSFYNAGRDGEHIFYHYAVLKSMLKRYTPKVVLLDFNNAELIQGKEKYDRISSLLPYYKTHEEIRTLIELKSPYEKLKLFSSIYPFNSDLFTIAIGNTEANKNRDPDFKGYVPLSRKWKEAIQQNNGAGNTAIDTVQVNIYKAFINDCLSRKIKLYVICSPYFIQFTNVDSSLIIAKNIAAQNHVSFLDYSGDTSFTKHPELFDDPSHLNADGAKIFANKLADEINKSEK